MEVLELKFVGHAEPAGSKRVVQPRGAPRARVIDANPKARGWKDNVAAQAHDQYPGPVLIQPLIVEMTFYQPHAKGHYGSGRNAELLKDSAPAYPAKKPDALKLARAVEDALTGVVWADDEQTVDLIVRKRYVGRSEPEYVRVRIVPAPAVTVADLVSLGMLEPPRPSALWGEQLSLLAPAAA